MYKGKYACYFRHSMLANYHFSLWCVDIISYYNMQAVITETTRQPDQQVTKDTCRKLPLITDISITKVFSLGVVHLLRNLAAKF